MELGLAGMVLPRSGTPTAAGLQSSMSAAPDNGCAARAASVSTAAPAVKSLSAQSNGNSGSYAG